MTREEARIELQAMKDTFEEYEPGGSRCQMALKVALTALRPVSREQVEKVWRGEWIKRHKHRGGFRRVKGIDDMGEQHEVTIDERCEYDDLYCSKCGKQSPDNFLNFCGYCGAPMTDEAVEMVMERMEKLHEDNGCS
ncbi:zinc ribbon domain-containing protein [uncultured Oscillibacter sp.]|uniref:zinc ribbon domain-containing protein n=1 Tax=uncultured Oscillibacter sp. TaxID=876091 RepID=UPI002610C255|nr:zinc ribbon domain-containing protein [uncultured Oscillibacter sp.]